MKLFNEDSGETSLEKFDPHIVIKFHNGRLTPGTPPTVHHTHEAALEEGARLARQFPGIEYCVFRHVSSLVTESAPVLELHYE